MMAVDWSGTYSTELRVYRVNPDTWANSELVGNVTEAQVVYSSEGKAPALASGSLRIDMAPQAEFAEGYHRICVVGEQHGVRERADLCTLYCWSGGGDVERGIASREVEGASVLLPAERQRLLAGTYAPKGADGAEYVADLLSSCIAAPVRASGSFTLDSHVVFDVGSTYLEAAWLVLDAGGFCMRLAGDGTVEVMAMPTEPSEIFGGMAGVADGISVTLDTSEIPNRYTAIDGAESETVVNDDPLSPISTVARGHVYDEIDESPVRVNGETLAAYAARKLEEASVARDWREYSRAWIPGVMPFDIVRASSPSNGFDGDYRISQQSVKYGGGLTVSEKACREVRLWQRAN